jgi:Bacteriophage HK97-gp10, putative tail-component
MARVKIRGLNSGLAKVKKIVREQAEQTMRDCMNDLARVSSETTPIDEGDLEQSWDVRVEQRGDITYGHVRYECWADAPNRSYDFNYAIWIHEQDYNLGEKSKQKKGGKGLSGKHYPVGKQYLTRPFYGEAPTYREMFEKNIKGSLREG